MDDSQNNENALPPGRGFRFGATVGSNLHSGIWEIRTGKNSRDVYLHVAHLGNVVKVSFHQSGQWQFSLTDSVAMQYVEHNRHRHLAKWFRPKPFADGLTRAFYITIPRTEFRDRGADGDMRLAPDPGGEHGVTIDVLFVESGSSVQINYTDGAYVLGRLQMFDGGEVLVVARPQAPDKNAGEHVRRSREGILEAISEGRLAGDGPGPGGNTLACLFIESVDGTPGFIEFDFTEQPAEVRRICTAGDFARDRVERYVGRDHPASEG